MARCSLLVVAFTGLTLHGCATDPETPEAIRAEACSDVCVQHGKLPCKGRDLDVLNPLSFVVEFAVGSCEAQCNSRLEPAACQRAHDALILCRHREWRAEEEPMSRQRLTAVMRKPFRSAKHAARVLRCPRQTQTDAIPVSLASIPVVAAVPSSWATAPHSVMKTAPSTGLAQTNFAAWTGTARWRAKPMADRFARAVNDRSRCDPTAERERHSSSSPRALKSGERHSN
jgi:hypothetical protein